MSKNLIFLVDDDSLHLEMLRDHLQEYIKADIKSFTTGEQCLEHLDEDPDIVVLDYNLDNENKEARNGIEILNDIKRINPDTEVIILSGQDKLQVAVDMMKYGAFDYVVKNESGFIRTQNSILNIYKQQNFERIARKGKQMAYLMITVFVLIIAFSLIVYFFFPDIIPERAQRV